MFTYGALLFIQKDRESAFCHLRCFREVDVSDMMNDQGVLKIEHHNTIAIFGLGTS